MDEPEPRRPGAPVTPKIGDDPDGGQVIGPDGESPEDPVARGLQNGCLIGVLIIGVFLGVFMLIYRFLIAERPDMIPDPRPPDVVEADPDAPL